MSTFHRVSIKEFADVVCGLGYTFGQYPNTDEVTCYKVIGGRTIWIFSSIDKGSYWCREVGSDAIRMVVIRKGRIVAVKRVFRVVNWRQNLTRVIKAEESWT